jgi:hypothetical protein
VDTASRSVRRALAVILAVAVAALASVACSSDSDSATRGPVPFTAADGRFTAEFPEAPTRQQEAVSAAGIDLVVVSYSTESDDDSVMVGYTDYPDGFEPEGVLEAAAQGSADNVNGRIQSSTDLTYLDHPAKDVVVTTDEATIHERLFLVGTRMYTLIGVARDSRPPAYDHLLDTFKLI